MTWEEFVDALRDATGASADEPASAARAKSYDALERPVMKRNESFQKLAMDLEEVIASRSSGTSAEHTPEGSTRGIQRISSSGMILGIGCSSREPSLRGGNAFYAGAAARADELRRRLEASETP